MNRDGVEAYEDYYNYQVAFKDTFLYNMASSVSGQNEPSAALRMATRARKMELSCPLETTCCVPQEKFPREPYNKSFIVDQGC